MKRLFKLPYSLSVLPVKSLKDAAKLYFTGPIEEMTPEDLWYAASEMAVKDGLEDFVT